MIRVKLKLVSYPESSKLAWRTKSGRWIMIKDMSDNHIHHVLLCLEGKGYSVIPEYYYGKTRVQWRAVFYRELRVRKYKQQQ